jgi:peptidoglycan/xylan/chitin deacetylase (PgdA/CDA1 family)
MKHMPAVRSWVLLLALALVGGLIAPVAATATPVTPAQVSSSAVFTAAPAVTTTAVSTTTTAPEFNPYRCGNNTKRVLLVFDDYPVSLARYKALVRQAAALGIGIGIAPNGKYIRSGRVDVNYARHRGMYVIDHGYDHYDLRYLSRAKIKWEITRPYNGSNYVRPPYGAHNAKVDAVFRENHKRMCLWNLDPRDWAYGTTATHAAHTIIRTARAGSVAVVHLNHLGAQPSLLVNIKRGLAARGLKLCRPYRVNGRVATSPVKLPASLPC